MRKSANFMKLLEGLYVYKKPGMGPHGSHTYVLVGTQKVLLVDPGFSHNLQDLVTEMVQDGLNPRDVSMIANTHLHLDHSDADEAFAKLSGAWIVLHRSQLEFTNSDVSTHKIFRVPKIVDSTYESEIELGGVRVRVVETPGHAPGHVCFYWPEKRVLMSGDLIFEKNVGRFDLPGGDEAEERMSLEKIASLDTEILLPSHGNILRTREEVRQNFSYVLNNWATIE